MLGAPAMDEYLFAADQGQLSFRWAHAVAAVVWLGMLYAAAWVHAPATAALEPAARPRAVSELAPRTLYWLRWSAAWAWFTGVCLLFLLYYVGGQGLFFRAGARLDRFEPLPTEWGPPFAALFVGFVLYDALFRFVGARGRAAGWLCGALWGALAVGFHAWLTARWDVSYRAGFVHVGALFGTVMAGNVWVRIWPAQRRIVTAVGRGEEPPAREVALSAARMRHNAAMSLAVVFLMIDAGQGRYGAVDGWRSSSIALAGVLAVSAAAAAGLERLSRRVPGYRPRDGSAA